MVALDLVFKIILGTIAVLTVALLLNNYININMELNIGEDTKENLQTIVVNNEDDLAKAIYSCYIQSNFGEINERIQCYIAKIQSNINWAIIEQYLENKGISDRAYDKPRLKNGDIVIIYYENYKISFKKI